MWGRKEVYLACLRIGITARDVGRGGVTLGVLESPGSVKGRVRACLGCLLASPNPTASPRLCLEMGWML